LLTWVELMGLKPAAHHKLLIQALQETADGKIDRFATRLSQINLRLDSVPGMVFGARPWQPPRAYAERPGRQPHDRARRLFGRELLLGGYLKPRQPCASRDAGACVERAADPLNSRRIDAKPCSDPAHALCAPRLV